MSLWHIDLLPSAFLTNSFFLINIYICIYVYYVDLCWSLTCGAVDALSRCSPKSFCQNNRTNWNEIIKSHSPRLQKPGVSQDTWTLQRIPGLRVISLSLLKRSWSKSVSYLSFICLKRALKRSCNCAIWKSIMKLMLKFQKLARKLPFHARLTVYNWKLKAGNLKTSISYEASWKDEKRTYPDLQSGLQVFPQWQFT